MEKIISIDPGLQGCITIFRRSFTHSSGWCIDSLNNMPLSKIETRPKRTKFKYKDPKIVIKSGPNKGNRPLVTMTPAKHKTLINWKSVAQILQDCPRDTQVVIENQFSISARSRSIYENYGRLLGHVDGYFSEPALVIQPAKWKEYYGLTNLEKEASLVKANEIDPDSTFTSHDQADSALIGRYFIKHVLGN